MHNVGRKNYLPAGSHDAAPGAAIIYSLIATCKKNGVELSEWVIDVLTRIRDHPVNMIEEMLPDKWEKQPFAKDSR